MLDSFHALKYMGNRAHLLFGEGTSEAKSQADRGRGLQLSDGYDGIETWVSVMLRVEPRSGDGAFLAGVLNYLRAIPTG